MCYTLVVSTVISQRDLRNNSGEIMRALDRGEEFIVTRSGIPVGELRPIRRRFVGRAAVAAAMAGAPPIDARRFLDDVDAILDQDAEPRA
jgi:antitoxin (DNA-binding transcriptional repressor) of toxin-antitoxin stability system